MGLSLSIALFALLVHYLSEVNWFWHFFIHQRHGFLMGNPCLRTLKVSYLGPGLTCNNLDEEAVPSNSLVLPAGTCLLVS